LAKTPANIRPSEAEKFPTANLGFAGSRNFFSQQIQIPIDYQKLSPDSKKNICRDSKRNLEKNSSINMFFFAI
jgi:hypothetical protein